MTRLRISPRLARPLFSRMLLLCPGKEPSLAAMMYYRQVRLFVTHLEFTRKKAQCKKVYEYPTGVTADEEIQKRVEELMQGPSPFSRPPVPTSSSSNFPPVVPFNDPNSHLTLGLDNTAQRTHQVAENIDLLQDHLLDVASLVGIDPDSFMNFHGTDDDRDTLLSLMAQSTGSPPNMYHTDASLNSQDFPSSMRVAPPQATSPSTANQLQELLGTMEPQPGAASSNFFPLEDAEFDQDLLDLETTASQPAITGAVGENNTQSTGSKNPIAITSKRRTPGRTSK
jgi:hypothetical protein